MLTLQRLILLADSEALVDDSDALVLADSDALVDADSDADVLADYSADVLADSEALVLIQGQRQQRLRALGEARMLMLQF